MYKGVAKLLSVRLSLLDRIMLFPLCFSLLPLAMFSISTANFEEKPTPYDPISYTCLEGEYAMETRRNNSKANRERPGQWKTACENETLELNCAKGNTIRIINVEFGRTDGTTCQYYSGFFLSCTSKQAFYKVHQRCDNKEKCSIKANVEEFGDPCPGIVKYLNVKHRCEPANDLQSRTVCENERVKLQCPKGKTITIASAFYGRSDATTCPHTFMSNTVCTSNNALDIISSRCDSKQECDLSAVNGWFDDPCKGTYKYLKVDYQCVIDDVQYAVACGGGVLDVQCKNSSNIYVIRAEYGRVHPFICNPTSQPIEPKGCSSPNELAIVYGRCQGKSNCLIPASSDVFGEPCVGKPKYLELYYFCGETWDKEDAPGAPIITGVTKNSVTFTSDKLNKMTSKKYKAQMKGADENDWTDAMDGEKALDFSEKHTISGLEPDKRIDIRIVMKKDSLSSCLAFTRFKTRHKTNLL